MKKKILAALFCVLLITVFVLAAGCTERMKQKPLATEFSDKVYSNGGLAVVYGKYLYFINGYAGAEAENIFGKAIKGAIMRVELKDGKPDGLPQTVVPKNVYGTDKEYGGIYIVNDFIYYSSPSTEKGSTGQPKTEEMKILRTKVDGTETEEILGFKDFKTVFAVEGDNLVYVREDYLYSVDLTKKKFEAVKVEEEKILTNYKMVDGYVIYCMYVNGVSTDYIMKCYKWSGGNPVVLMDAEQIRADKNKNTTYTLSLLCTESNDTTFTVYYTKTDNELNTPEVGICSYTFNKSAISYDRTKEIRFTNNTASTTNLAFTNFYKYDKYVLGLSDKTVVVFNEDGSIFKTIKKGTENEYAPTIITLSETITIYKLFEKNGSVYMRYEMGKTLYELKIFEINNINEYSYVEANSQKIFSGAVDASYCNFEEINGVIYYFNSNVSNNIYYYVIPENITKDTNTAKSVLLGIITDEDFIATF